MVEEISHDRRRSLVTAIMTIASGELGIIGSAAAQSSNAKPATVPAIKPGANKSFGPLKQINAGQTDPESIVTSVRLVVRQSCGAPVKQLEELA